MAEQVELNLEKLYGDRSQVLRDTHAKTHACVRGNLEIFDIDEQAIKQVLKQRTSLSPEQIDAISFKQGLFAQSQRYPVWIRFANGRAEVEDDYVDVTIIWPEAAAPFFKVGRLTVAHQIIDFATQCDFCENLHFSPWNGLAAHHPIGALNRLRAGVTRNRPAQKGLSQLRQSAIRPCSLFRGNGSKSPFLSYER